MAFDRPIYAYQVPEAERPNRVRLSSDLCVIDEDAYFIRGLIEIPIRNHQESLGIGAWVSQKEENFRAYEENFDSPEIGPFFGWLSSDFVYGGARTLNLKTMVRFQRGNLRPNIELEPTDHPLAVAQRDGITLDEAWSFIHEQLDRSTE